MGWAEANANAIARAEDGVQARTIIAFLSGGIEGGAHLDQRHQ